MSDISSCLSTALADRYQIDHEVGSGGMATVYLAEDLKLHRKVALKVLRPELAAALGPERFLREIEISANLNHPHILALYDSGEAEGFLFYVMPYVEGQSLRDRLNREKQLPVDDALKITREVADALGFAHSHGVVHRDIKPENILLQDGVAVVTDFGIALAVSTVGGARLTETGLSVGTPAYMSPEQVSGDRELDGRSDLYSLACVVYEMVAGDPPFVASTAQAVMARHATDIAPPVTTVRPEVDAPVAAAIAKALRKAPADRYDTVGVFARALLAPAEEAKPTAKSILVLPFANLSPDPDNEYFADGLTEEITADLSQVRALRVISRTSAMQLKGTSKNVRTIGRDENVRYIVEGSVRKAGNNLRVTAQLIDAVTDAHLWADKYAGTLDDVFEIQERLARRIVDALKVTLSPEEDRRIAERPIDNVQAYECYLRAWDQVWTGSTEGLNRALGLIATGLELAGDNEMLYAALGKVHFEAVNVMVEPNEAHLEKVEECIDKIRVLNPDSPHAHFLAAAVRYKRGAVQDAVRHLKRTLATDPHDPATLYHLASLFAISGKPDAARPYARRLLEIGPLTPHHQWWWAWVEALGGNFGVALEPMRKTYHVHPQHLITAYLYAVALVLNGRRDDAYPVIDQLASDAPHHVVAQVSLFFKYALQGNERMALQTVTPELTTAVKWDEHGSWHMAGCYALLDHREEALEWLEHAALDRGFINYPLLSKTDPLLANLRADSRFEHLMRRVKKRWEQFEV